MFSITWGEILSWIVRFFARSVSKTVSIAPWLAKNRSSLATPSFRSGSDTIAYLRYTASVLCPVNFIATERGTSACSRFLTAVRLKSCGMRPGTPAALHAFSQALR